MKTVLVLWFELVLTRIKATNSCFQDMKPVAANQMLVTTHQVKVTIEKEIITIHQEDVRK